MLKRVDVAAYRTLKDAMDGKFTVGRVTLGLAEGGVDWAQDTITPRLEGVRLSCAVGRATEPLFTALGAACDEGPLKLPTALIPTLPSAFTWFCSPASSGAPFRRPPSGGRTSRSPDT